MSTPAAAAGDTPPSKTTDLLRIVTKQTRHSIENLNVSLRYANEKLDSKVGAIKSEIKNRVDVLKCELEKTASKFEEMIEARKRLIIEQESGNVEKALFVYDTHLNELESLNGNISEEKLHASQKMLQIMNKQIEKLSKIKFDAIFDASTDCITETQFGSLIFSKHTSRTAICNTEQIESKLKDVKYTLITVKEKPIDLCILPNGNLACSAEKGLLIFDENMNCIKRQPTSDDFKPEYLTCNKVNRLYISDTKRNQLVMTDLEFKKLKVYNTQLCSPMGVTYFGNRVYLCDTGNKQIAIFSTELELIAKLPPLQFQPWQIKFIKTVACIRPHDTGSIYFYSLEPFRIARKVDYHYGSLSVMNSFFYEYYAPNKKIYCYTGDGKLVQEIKTLVWTNDYAMHLKDGCMLQFYDKILFTSWSSGKIIIL